MHSRSRRRFALNRCTAAVFVAMVSLTLAGPSHAMEMDGPSSQASVYEFDIPEQSLAEALQAFARASRQQVSFDSAMLRGKRSNALVGSYTAREALEKLLDGSGLNFQVGAQGIWMVGPRQPASGAIENRDVIDLRSVEVAMKGPPRRTTGGALGGRKDLDTPFSLSTVTAEDIQDRQAYSLMTAFAHEAGVSRAAGSDYNGWASWLIVRGLPIDFNESVKINGVPGGFLFGVNLPIEDMDSVQLLKGASGFMYGFSAPGGIVNYRTKQPTPYDLLSFDVGYRSDSLFSQHVDMSGQLARDGRLGFRINASHEKGVAYSDSKVERKAVALTFNGRLTENLAWTFDALGQINDTDRPMPYYGILGGMFSGDRLPPDISNKVNPASDQSAISNKFHYLTAGLYWEMSPGWDLSINASKSYSTFRLSQEYMYFINREGDYQSRTLDGLNLFSADFAQAMLQGKFSTGGIQHEPVMGASWQRRSGRLGRTNYFPGTVTRGQSNIHNPEKLVWTPFPGEPTDSMYSDTFQRSIFASDTVKLGDKWSVLAGLRYIEYTQYLASTNTLDPDGVYVHHQYTRYDKSTLTPTAALMYKPHDGATLYASYVESLEPGRTVGATFLNEGDHLDPLLSKQYELGYKYEDARWAASAALFRIDRDAGYGKLVPGEARPLYVQDGIHRYDGIEMAGSIMLTDNLRWGGSVQYIDGVYHDMGEGALRAGKQVEGVAKYMAAMHISYELPWVDGVTVHADGKYFGETVVQNYERVIEGANRLYSAKTPGYAVFNVGGSYRTRIGEIPMTLRAQVLNLFDRSYLQGGSYNFAIGAPRTLALNVQFDF